MSPTQPPSTSSSAQVSARLGGLDVLVNNVGVAGPTAAVDEMDPDAFDHCVRVNLGSMFRCTRRPCRCSVSCPARSSTSRRRPESSGIHCARRTPPPSGASIGLTKTWAMELGPEGIRVNAICPGSVGGSRMDGVIEREAASAGSAGVEREVGLREPGLDGLVRRRRRHRRGSRVPVVAGRPVHIRAGARRRWTHGDLAHQLFTVEFEGAARITGL